MALLRKIALFSSGEGTTFEYVWDQCVSKILDAKVVLAVSNRACPFIEKAAARGVPTLVTKDWGLITETLRSVCPDLNVMSGFMRIIPPAVLEGQNFINIHPSYLPELAGKDPQAQAIQKGVSSTGLTIHITTAGIDEGPILKQYKIPVLPNETEESLSRRLKLLSYRVLSEVLEEYYGYRHN